MIIIDRRALIVTTKKILHLVPQNKVLELICYSIQSVEPGMVPERSEQSDM